MSQGFSLKEQLESLTARERGEVMEEQDITARVARAEYKPAKKGTPGWEYQAVMLDGPWAGEEIVGKIWFSRKAADMFMAHVTALGITQEFIDTNPTPEQIADAIVGATFRGKVEINEYRGRKSNQITAFEYLGEDETLVEEGSGDDDDDFVVPPPAGEAIGDAEPEDLADIWNSAKV